MTVVLVGLEKKNKEVVAILNKYGYNGNQLLKKLPRLDPKKQEADVFYSHTRERQDLLAKANTVGSRLLATVGEILN